ncbi:MAG: glycosyltransferase [Clostridia bacterium]|nr:glycosyltransferase [Clostridia bacterium]
MMKTLYIIIPCYNEEKVLPLTAPMFLKKINQLQEEGLISDNSRILFIDDGSRDDTWSIIQSLAKEDVHYTGIRQSRNRGHQNAVLAGLMEAKDKCDITISIDCDGQDDINAMDDMVQAYLDGCEVVYGVRKERKTDTFFKRFTAESFYKVLKWMGADVVFNHADYRLISSRVLNEFANFKEVNLYLRGMVPLVGFKSTSVYYARHERLAGESHYPLKKMLALAFEGITSLSTKPLKMITILGIGVVFLSLLAAFITLLVLLFGGAAGGIWWLALLIAFFAGVQIICTGLVGSYVGKAYMEVKARPRYIISERTKENE